MHFFHGYLIGLSTIIFFGAVFFTILNATLSYGQKAGWLVILGIIISDAIAVGLCSFLAPFILNQNTQYWMAIAGSVILVLLGLVYILKPAKPKNEMIPLGIKEHSVFFMKGFVVNFFSPFTFAYWLGTVTYANSTYESLGVQILFYTTILLGIFTIDVLKIYLAQFLKKALTTATLKIISRISGVVLLFFAFRMIWYILENS